MVSQTSFFFFFVHTWETKPSNKTASEQTKKQLNTMCCNSFHLMKGVEPQWNYGGYSGYNEYSAYSGSPMWHRSYTTELPEWPTTVGWFNVTVPRSFLVDWVMQQRNVRPIFPLNKNQEVPAEIYVCSTYCPCN